MHIILSIREEFGRWELDSLIKSRDVRDITRVGESYFPSFHQSGRGGGGGKAMRKQVTFWDFRSDIRGFIFELWE